MNATLYRVWTLNGKWVAKESHSSLEAATEAAHQLSTKTSAAIEISGATRRWHTFADGSQVLSQSQRIERVSARHSTAELLERHRPKAILGDGTPATVVDFSLDGLRLAVPNRYRARLPKESAVADVRLASGWGQLQVCARVAWRRINEIGLEIDWGRTPSFGRSFLTRMAQEADGK